MDNDGEHYTEQNIYNNLRIANDEHFFDFPEESGVIPYIFGSLDDILSVVDKLVAKEQISYIYPVTHIYDLKQMFRCGLWPTSLTLDGLWFDSWLDDVDINTIYFWNPSKIPIKLNEKFVFVNVDKILEMLKYETRWQYKPLEQWKREAIETGNSIALKLYAPELMYHISKRPKTDMSLFRNPLSHLIIYPGPKTIPVTRYAKGMSRSLFYSESDQKFCGTFYYHDIESTTYLAYETALVAFNKTDAMNMLDPNYYNNYYHELEFRYSNYPDRLQRIHNHINGLYPKSLMLTPREAFDLYGEQISANLLKSILPIEEFINFRYVQDKKQYIRDHILTKIPDTKYYAGRYLDLYAGEDILDQVLCTLANKAGYDIVILTNMIGSFQVVTEVLDTRSREDSFRSLIYTNNSLYPL